MDIPGVYEIVSEYFNNEVLERYEEEQEDAINMTYEEAVDSFTENILPIVVEQYGPDDTISQREAFNDWTDALCKDGEITQWQYENWDNPF